MSLRGDIDSWFRGHGHDFYRIRPSYEALEGARHGIWKATAHTGALHVREFAHTSKSRRSPFSWTSMCRRPAARPGSRTPWTAAPISHGPCRAAAPTPPVSSARTSNSAARMRPMSTLF